MRKDDFIMRRVFICSPYRGKIEENIKKAKFYGKIVIGTGRIPVIPHLYFPAFLDENNPNERMTGIEMGLELMDCCDVVYVFGFDITEGMKFELAHARKKKIPVRLYDDKFHAVNVRTLPVDERVTSEYRMALEGLRLK